MQIISTAKKVSRDFTNKIEFILLEKHKIRAYEVYWLRQFPTACSEKTQHKRLVKQWSRRWVSTADSPADICPPQPPTAGFTSEPQSQYDPWCEEMSLAAFSVRHTVSFPFQNNSCQLGDLYASEGTQTPYRIKSLHFHRVLSRETSFLSCLISIKICEEDCRYSAASVKNVIACKRFRWENCHNSKQIAFLNPIV